MTIYLLKWYLPICRPSSFVGFPDETGGVGGVGVGSVFLLIYHLGMKTAQNSSYKKYIFRHSSQFQGLCSTKVPAKRFKIWHISYIRKPKVAFSDFHFMLLYIFA